MSHWAFVLAAYAVVAAVLVGYWWRVERRIRVLDGGRVPAAGMPDRSAPRVGPGARPEAGRRP